MGNKKKASRVFGKGLGRHRKQRKSYNLGRPKYHIKKSKKASLKLTFQKIKKVCKDSLQNLQEKTLYTVFPSSQYDLRIKLRKVHNLAPKGYRIINLECLQQHVSDITMHVCTCLDAIRISNEGKSPIKLENEINNYGLASVMMAQCQGCSKKFKMETSPKVPGSKRYDINVRAVWGSMVTGNGPAHLNEFMGTLNAPGISQPTFSSIETEIGEWWHSVLQKEMLIAGQVERQLAINRNDFHQDVPAITVITDGGWSKRTHKHSYNAAGGVAIIIGKETQKLLHIGVRNKYCYICNSGSTKEHICFKNWDQDSQSMESDIIIQGFKEAENKHGLRYMRVIGDGDSSVFARIKEEVPGWGRYVTKEECANHVCKCYRSKLEKLVSDNPLYKGKHHLTKGTRVRLVSAVRCAIRVRSKEVSLNNSNKSVAIQKLKHDIKNSVYHVFGLHSNCSDFCRAHLQSSSSTDLDTSSIPENDGTKTVLDEQIDFWTEGSSISFQDESRNGTTISYSNVEQHIIKDVNSLLLQISEKADRLLNNSTTNLAECWMSMRAKLDGGKVHNLCNRGSWHARCYGGALRMNLGPQWSCDVWECATASEPGYFFRRLYARREQTLQNANRYRKKPQSKELRWKKKMSSMKACTTKKARTAYGPEALDITQDVSPVDLDKIQSSFLENHINISSHKCQQISQSTIQQSQSGLWHSERQKRITASNFGLIVKRNPTLPVKKIVKTMLYSTFRGNRHTRNGILQEDTTIEEYKLKKAEQQENVIVQRSGLVIHPTHKYLAGSPDGIVVSTTGESGLIEIKNLLHSKPLNLWQASEKSSFCLKNSNGKLLLKENHNYFFQCHGLLNICNKNWIDFVVRTMNPYQLFIQRIYRDNIIWEKMLAKLQAFYFKALLPELALPREGKCPGIREPGIWYVPPAEQKKTGPIKRRRREAHCSHSPEQEDTCQEPASVQHRRREASCSHSPNSLDLYPEPARTFRQPSHAQHSSRQRRETKYSKSSDSSHPEPASTCRQPVPAQHSSRQSREADCSKSSDSSHPEPASTCQQPTPAQHRSTRYRPTKFLGRQIIHEWVVDEETNRKEWFRGTVVNVLSGKDGYPNAVYEVFYEGDVDSYEIDHLIQDYAAGSVQFCDI